MIRQSYKGYLFQEKQANRQFPIELQTFLKMTCKSGTKNLRRQLWTERAGRSLCQPSINSNSTWPQRTLTFRRVLIVSPKEETVVKVLRLSITSTFSASVTQTRWTTWFRRMWEARHQTLASLTLSSTWGTTSLSRSSRELSPGSTPRLKSSSQSKPTRASSLSLPSWARKVRAEQLQKERPIQTINLLIEEMMKLAQKESTPKRRCRNLTLISLGKRTCKRWGTCLRNKMYFLLCNGSQTWGAGTLIRWSRRRTKMKIKITMERNDKGKDYEFIFISRILRWKQVININLT